MRMRVVIDVTKLLLRSKKLNIRLPTPVWVCFTYNRLPDFCFCYGTLGHNHIECTDWVGATKLYEQDGFPYGKWLYGDIGGKGSSSALKEKNNATKPRGGMPRLLMTQPTLWPVHRTQVGC